MSRGSLVGTSLLAVASIAALSVALAPAANATQEHLSICHSGSGANWTFIEPAAPGYNGHQHHELDVYGLTEAECLAKNVVEEPPVDPTKPKSVALYLYNKLNDAAPAAWENSGLQTLYTTHDGDAWFTSVPTIPADICGPGWAYQQDKAYKTADSWPTNIEYPTDNIGWPPIYDAKHGELSELITVPDCVVDEPPVIPETPEPTVVTTLGEYGGDAVTCAIKQRDWTRTITTVTTTYTVELVNGAYETIKHVGAPVITIDPQVLTVLWDGEDCPVDEPPVEEPPVTNPPVEPPVTQAPPAPPVLAETAVRVSPVAVIFGFAALLLGGVAVWATSRYANRVKNDK